MMKVVAKYYLMKKVNAVKFNKKQVKIQTMGEIIYYIIFS